VNTVPSAHISRQRSATRRQRGAAAVEFALVLPLLLTLVMGTIDWGWFFYIDQLCTNAAREGARAGSVMAPTATTTQVRDAAQQASQAFLNNVNLKQAGVIATSMLALPGGSQGVNVVVTYPVGSVTGFLTGIMRPNVVAASVMRWP